LIRQVPSLVYQCKVAGDVSISATFTVVFMKTQQLKDGGDQTLRGVDLEAMPWYHFGICLPKGVLWSSFQPQEEELGKVGIGQQRSESNLFGTWARHDGRECARKNNARDLVTHRWYAGHEEAHWEL
jgi:hypothetical protein